MPVMLLVKRRQRVARVDLKVGEIGEQPEWHPGKPKHDKVGRRIEISATVSEAVADAFKSTKALRKEGSVVVARDIAGARSVSRDHPRIVERMAA